MRPGALLLQPRLPEGSFAPPIHSLGAAPGGEPGSGRGLPGPWPVAMTALTSHHWRRKPLSLHMSPTHAAPSLSLSLP